MEKYTEYRVEMKQYGKWMRAAKPFCGFIPFSQDHKRVCKWMKEAQETWATTKDIHPEYFNDIPTEWRILKREVIETDWEEVK